MGKAVRFHEGLRAYAAFTRLQHKKRHVQEARAKRRRDTLEKRLEEKRERPITQAQIELILLHPSKRGVTLLKEAVTSGKTKPTARVQAALAVLELTGIFNDKPGRGRPRGRGNKGPGA